MKIAIDASTISTQGGPRTYLLGLLDALFRIDHENEYVVFYNDPSHMGRFPMAREIVLPGKNPLARLFREHLLLPLACRREKVDLLHCPKSAIPVWAPCPVVVTLHDLIPVKHPELEKFAAHLYWRLHIPYAARRSDFVITISQWAREEIMREYGVSADRIAVVMQSYDPAMAAPRDPVEGGRIRARYGLPWGYLLYVGTIQPRKNLMTLIEAYALLKKQGGVPEKLVIVGRKGWLYEGLFSRVRELGLENDIIFTGFVPDEELPFIYDGARLFVYLSLLEGFGRPPLEAMACGVPVITSDTSAIPEVIGDAGIAVPPTDTAKVVEAIGRVLADPASADVMREKGLARAASFSWDAAARETLQVYEQVVAGSCHRKP
ncbi:MAG: glycosyltransferase family 4 protein [Geobacter sp.]|nr:glycosyltransferase family 4 protein [Geobacter sp.]